MSDYFKNFLIDTWYKVLVYLGGILFIFGLFIPSRVITNKQLILFSLGLFFIGLGEWKNMKNFSYIKPPNIYTGPTAFMSGKTREPDIFGILFDIVGITLLILFLIDLFRKISPGNGFI